MKKVLLTIVLTFILTAGLLPFLALAQNQPINEPIMTNPNERLNNVVQDTGLTGTRPGDQPSPAVVVMRVIQIALGFVGLIFFIQIFLAGFQWMTSADSPEKIKKAKARLTNSIIGLAIILGAYLITVAISTYIIQATDVIYY